MLKKQPLYDNFSLAYSRQALSNSKLIAQRWPHPSTVIFLPHPILIPQKKLNAWASDACCIADLLSNTNVYSKGLPSLNKTLKSDTPDCFSVDFAVIEENGELSIRLIEAQAFPSAMSLMLDLEDIFGPAPEICNLSTQDRRILVESAVTQNLPAENIVMLDQNIIGQGTADDFMSSLHIASPRSIMDIYSVDNQWMHWRDNGVKKIKRCYHRSIFHTLHQDEQAHMLELLTHKDISHFNHPAWYYKVDKASLSRISHWSIPKTFSTEDANELDLNTMVLKHPNGFGGKEVFLSPNLADIEQAPKDSILQEKIKYAAFHPTLKSDKKLCVELRFMLLHTASGYKPVSLLARATYDGNLMRYKEKQLPGEGYTCAIGYRETQCSE